ncbi:MAG: ABC transporter permease [Defluviitaleaceae bacterium]|nr:ABC transporter permease [Defluviitaleaceae bacterium]MCL2239800.1 ABC transporter permease [Defluviitaleaceae bacterium]
MKLTAKLAYSQLVINKRRTLWTLLGIVLSTAMITAVFGFAASGAAAITALMGDMYVRDVYYTTIFGAGGVLSLIIVGVSVIVVSNAFRVSAGERLTQFGMLKSVGATKKQIAQTVVYEGLLLSVIGVPIGIFVGLLVQFAGVHVANHMLADMNAFQAEDNTLTFGFVLAWQAVLVSMAMAFVTVLLSAWLPARKAAKIAAIDAIRGVHEIKIKSKPMRANWLVRKLFGFEGELASKSLKRSRRNFRATVSSLAFSMALFIAASSFGTQLFQMANLVFALIEADVVATFHSSWLGRVGEDGEIAEQRYMSISTEEAERITARMRAFEGARVFGVGGNHFRYTVDREELRFTPDFERMGGNEWLILPTDDAFPVNLLTVDHENYAELARRAGVPLGSNILINHVRTRYNGNWAAFAPLVFSGQTLRMQSHDGYVVYLPLHGELRGADVPNEIIHAAMSYVMVIVPEMNAHFYFWAVQTDDPHIFADYARGFFRDMIPPCDDVASMAHVFDQAAEDNAIRSLFNTIMIAMYGFIGMLTLIALTNVISTISTNVRSRSREFAVLQSVGMTHTGLKNMLNLESILCSVKSLIYGIPLGVGASYLMYMFVMESVRFSFEMPWLAILQCVVAVFAITWLTMRFSVARLRGGSLVDGIRGN